MYTPRTTATRLGQHVDNDTFGDTTTKLRHLVQEDLELHDKQQEINATVSTALELIKEWKRDMQKAELPIKVTAMREQIKWQWVAISVLGIALFELYRSKR